MNKILTLLFAGLFAFSVGASAADAAKPADQVAPTAVAATAKEKPATPSAKKHMHKHKTTSSKAATPAEPATK